MQERKSRYTSKIGDGPHGFVIEGPTDAPRKSRAAEGGTAGPWSVRPCNHGGGTLIRPGCVQEEIQILPMEDAALMASAPALLAALEVCVKWLERDHPDEMTRADCAKQARAALSAARGGGR